MGGYRLEETISICKYFTVNGNADRLNGFIQPDGDNETILHEWTQLVFLTVRKWKL